MKNDIVTCARGWLGTRFHHQGRLKKTVAHNGGVDCLGLLVGVADELQLTTPDGQRLSAADDTRYSHLPDTSELQRKLTSLLQEIPVEGIRHGDIVLLDINDSPQHLAIVSDWKDGFGIIHAYAQARKVVEHALDDYWRRHIIRAFRVSSSEPE